MASRRRQTAVSGQSHHARSTTLAQAEVKKRNMDSQHSKLFRAFISAEHYREQWSCKRT